MNGYQLNLNPGKGEANKRNIADLFCETIRREWKPQLENRPRLPPLKIVKSASSYGGAYSCHSQGRVALEGKGRVTQASAKEPAGDLRMAFQKAARSILSFYRAS